MQQMRIVVSEISHDSNISLRSLSKESNPSVGRLIEYEYPDFLDSDYMQACKRQLLRPF